MSVRSQTASPQTTVARKQLGQVPSVLRHHSISCNRLRRQLSAGHDTAYPRGSNDWQSSRHRAADSPKAERVPRRCASGVRKARRALRV